MKKIKLPLVVPAKMMAKIYLAVAFVVLVTTFFTSCEKDNPPQERNHPVIGQIVITDTTPSRDGYSVIDGFVKTEQAIGVYHTGLYGSFVPVNDDMAPFSVEVENGIKTAIVFTAVSDNNPETNNFDRDTLWVTIPTRSVGIPPDTIEGPDPIKTLPDYFTWEGWNVELSYHDNYLDTTYRIPGGDFKATYWSNGVSHLWSDRFNVFPNWKIIDSILYNENPLKVISVSNDSIILKQEDDDRGYYLRRMLKSS